MTAAPKPDLTYKPTDDGLFTAFYANTAAGEKAWREMAEQTDGTGKVFVQHTESVIYQLEQAGYIVAKVNSFKDSISDADLMAELFGEDMPSLAPSRSSPKP
ncbi:hypothetical protein ACKF11_13360 [Methylobacillus sp. Pita2]|uniref:hypothetical protein n=1 Tax=Methylobacillus sp. Pita2 TaxID=3383245 RepID=UPI0038B644F2